MNKVIVILGPTCVGKTKLSVMLAKKINGIIINADSMQIYKYLNIGTAKIKEEEKEDIVHHLFDIKELDEDYSIYNYQKDCRNKMKEIKSKGKTPILVGGTGLYIKSALYDYTLSEEKISETYDDLSDEELYNLLISLDKAIVIDKNNRRRLIRAINYYKEFGKSINENNNKDKLLYDNVIFIGLTTDRENLYNKINLRVDKMIDDGLLDEVRSLYDKKIYTKPIINGIGYKEVYDYFDGLVSYEEMIEKIKQNSRRYAKRQYTFFKNQMDINWFNVDYDCFFNTINDVKEFIDNYDNR